MAIDCSARIRHNLPSAESQMQWEYDCHGLPQHDAGGFSRRVQPLVAGHAAARRTRASGSAWRLACTRVRPAVSDGACARLNSYGHLSCHAIRILHEGCHVHTCCTFCMADVSRVHLRRCARSRRSQPATGANSCVHYVAAVGESQLTLLGLDGVNRLYVCPTYCHWFRRP